MQLQIFLCAVATILPIGTATASFRKPFSNILYRRQASGNGSSSGLILDLGYERYQGFYNNGTGLNNWFGYEWRTCYIYCRWTLIIHQCSLRSSSNRPAKVAAAYCSDLEP